MWWMRRQSRVRSVSCGLSATHPDSPGLENVIATGFWLVSFKRIKSKGVMEKEGWAPEGFEHIICWYFYKIIGKCWCSFFYNWIKCGHAGSLALFAKTCFIQIYSEELILIQTNHSLHLYSAVKSRKGECENLPFISWKCVSNSCEIREHLQVLLKKGQSLTFSFSDSSRPLHSSMWGRIQKRRTVSCDIQALNVVGCL